MRKIIYFLFLIIFNTIAFSQTIGTPDKIVIEVLYFHVNIRCETEQSIEANAKKVLQNSFSKELKEGKIVFKAINLEEPENEHYMKDFSIELQNLVITKKVDGKIQEWKNLEKVWEYISDLNKFRKYVEDEIREYLK